MCSDGLYDTVGATDLFARLREAHREATAPEALVDQLIEVALERGASDNVTALVVRQEAEVPSRAAPPRRVRGRAGGWARGCATPSFPSSWVWPSASPSACTS